MFRFRRKKQARANIQTAAQALNDSRSRTPEVNKLVDELKWRRRHNHFATSLEIVYRIPPGGSRSG